GVGDNLENVGQNGAYVLMQTDESVYYLGASDGLIYHWMGAGHDYTASGQVTGVYGRLSAGTDQFGHDQVFVRDYAGYVRKWRDNGVLTYTGGQADEIAAAGYGFALATAPGSHDLYGYYGGDW